MWTSGPLIYIDELGLEVTDGWLRVVKVIKSWQYFSCHWDACCNHSTISDSQAGFHRTITCSLASTRIIILPVPIPTKSSQVCCHVCSITIFAQMTDQDNFLPNWSLEPATLWPSDDNYSMPTSKLYYKQLLGVYMVVHYVTNCTILYSTVESHNKTHKMAYDVAIYCWVQRSILSMINYSFGFKPSSENSTR